MSVRTFSAEELANLAHVMLDVSPLVEPDSYLRAVETACATLALVSDANVRCFNARYAHKGACAALVSADEIKAELMRIDRASGNADALARALNTACGLRYNTDDEGGDFLLTVAGAHNAMLDIFEVLARALARKAGLNP
jgi:hypothetical protein